jgi:hypothetical protein
MLTATLFVERLCAKEELAAIDRSSHSAASRRIKCGERRDILENVRQSTAEKSWD